MNPRGRLAGLIRLRKRQADETLANKANTEVDLAKEEKEKEAIRKKLRKLGVSFQPNTGLRKLKEKLDLATDK